MNEKVDGLRELLGTALEANLTLTTVAQNDATKRSTSWPATFAIPTMIAGVYGMNFEFMPELHWKYGYLFAIVLILAACAFLYSRFKRSNWL